MQVNEDEMYGLHSLLELDLKTFEFGHWLMVYYLYSHYPPRRPHVEFSNRIPILFQDRHYPKRLEDE